MGFMYNKTEEGEGINMQFTLNTSKQINASTHVVYDTIILGGGPAGLNASIYSVRKGLKTLLITNTLGGQIENTKVVDNYLGFTEIDSQLLIKHFIDHAKNLGVIFQLGNQIISVKKEQQLFLIQLDNGLIYQSRTLIYALGSHARKLGLPGEDMLDKISYCAVCDAPFYKNLHVAVVGGGNSALEAALDLTHYASKVTIIQRSTLRADQILIDKVTAHPKINVLLKTFVRAIKGNQHVESLMLYQKDQDDSYDFKVDGLFIEIGHDANTKLIEHMVKLDDQKHIITDLYQQTSMEGFYACGDATHLEHKQIIIAASQGAIAALEASKFIQRRKEEN